MVDTDSLTIKACHTFQNHSPKPTAAAFASVRRCRSTRGCCLSGRLRLHRPCIKNNRPSTNVRLVLRDMALVCAM